MSLVSMILAFAPGLAVRLRPRSGPKLEVEVQQHLEQLQQNAAPLCRTRRQSLPNCVPGRHAFLAPRDSGNLGRFLGPGFPGRI